MKVLISSPYLDSLGGGERYVLTMAEILSQKHSVYLLWDGNAQIIPEAEKRFNLDLSKINLISQSLKALNIFQKYIFLRKYDLSIVLTDGSIPFLFAKKNYLHIQVPFSSNKQQNLLTKLKFKFLSGVICNSEFTKFWVQKTYPPTEQMVLYPPVDTAKIKSGVKEDLIFSVARFANHLNSKRQDILLKAFIKFHKKFPKYRLVLAGASNSNQNKYLSHLKVKASKLPIKFLINPPSSVLLSYYKKARYFWHAAGYHIDENKNPEQTEHFGMVLVEAMAAGCLVCAVNKGGAREIIESGKNGYLWESISDLVNCSKQLNKKVTLQAQVDAQKFSKEKFRFNLAKILNINL